MPWHEQLREVQDGIEHFLRDEQSPMLFPTIAADASILLEQIVEALGPPPPPKPEPVAPQAPTAPQAPQAPEAPPAIRIRAARPEAQQAADSVADMLNRFIRGELRQGLARQLVELALRVELLEQQAAANGTN